MKEIVVIGTESSGSTYLSRLLRRAVGDSTEIIVSHHSLPQTHRFEWYDIIGHEKANQSREFVYVICTRDITISELSRGRRWSHIADRNKLVHQTHSQKAKEIIEWVISSGRIYYIWSYETFMFLREVYFNELKKFCNILNDYNQIQDIQDKNRKYIIE